MFPVYLDSTLLAGSTAGAGLAVRPAGVIDPFNWVFTWFI
jgi:hypothetical protein